MEAVAGAFGAVARELRRLADLTSSLQDQLSLRGYDGLDIQTLQSVDSLNQTLGCLATYVGNVGALVADGQFHAIGDAADHVCLSALAERLRGGAGAREIASVAEVELF